jgi:hypothetical protein
MTYSRRQLEYFGEPLGECVTRLKPGGRIYGGGSSPSTPEKQTIEQTSIPEYAKPYVEKMLGKTEALTNAPYQTYQGERIAGFTPMQQQSQQAAANLGPAKQLGVGTQMAGLAGLGAMGAGQQYQQMATNPYAMQAYMSPYVESALAPQLREAQRQSAILGQQNQAQAVQQGAFGGSRSAIVEAERQRNLQNQMGDIYGRGMQSAFEQAQRAQQFGSTLGLQGMQTAGQLAGTLGQLGQTQFGQQQQALQTQAQMGQQQQALEQQRLAQQYQDFADQRQHPYQQLAFMSDMLRGLPLSQTAQTMYQAPPSMISQLGGLGLAAYGMFGNPQAPQSTGRAEGGLLEENDSAPGLGELALQNMMKKKA